MAALSHWRKWFDSLPDCTGKTYAIWLAPLMEWVAAHSPPYSELTKWSKAPGLRVLWITPLRALAADTASVLQAPLQDLGIPWTLETCTSDNRQV